MIEQEIINVIKHLNFCGLCTTGPCGECERKLAKDAALVALEKNPAVPGNRHRGGMPGGEGEAKGDEAHGDFSV